MGKIVGMIIGLSVAAMVASSGIDLSALGLVPAKRADIPAAKCDIKGNVSYDSGKHIYHMPGQEDYEDTKISTDRGERWFCSEAEARAAGWQKAGR